MALDLGLRVIRAVVQHLRSLGIPNRNTTITENTWRVKDE